MKILRATIFALTLLAFPFIAQAAMLYLDPLQGDYGPGDTIIVKIKLDNAGECINAIESGVAFSDNLRAIDFSIGESIINIWIEKPDTGDMNKINIDRRLDFSGGIPGGYCGSIAGNQGESNIIGELVFRVLDQAGASEGKVELKPETRMLINDGKGTAAKIELKNSAFRILSEKTQEADQWQARVDEDDILPEPFTIELLGGEKIYEGSFFIVFLAQDKQTGIDHYEVMEIRPELESESNNDIIKSLFSGKKPQWKNAQSPYLLEDQSLQSNIYVKAVDKAGNERTIKYFPADRQGEKIGFLSQVRKNMLLYGIAAIGLIISAGAIIALSLKKRKKNEIQ